ncbi:glycosyl transferase family 2 [Methylorubrum extorquens]
MLKRKTADIVGNIDVVDTTCIAGWAYARSGRSPKISIFIGGTPVNLAVSTIERNDVAEIYGEASRYAGFYIDISTICPDQSLGRERFFSTIQIRADNTVLMPSKNSKIPNSFRQKMTNSFISLCYSKIGSYLSRFGNYLQPKVHRDLTKSEKSVYFDGPNKMRRRHGKDLISITNNTNQIGRHTIIVVVVIRNECHRLPYFIEYYRKRGVGHFLVVDNGSSDGSKEYIKSQSDCSLWYTEASYKASNFGIHWTNYLLHTYGTEHWCLTVDPDEFFVYPHCESRNLFELVEYLASNGQYEMFCVLVDMYSSKNVSQTVYVTGQNPIEVCPYFDKSGYTQRENASYGDTFVQGGPRRRVFFRDNPSRAPAINKTPLVYWKKDYNYISSTHLLAPKNINKPHKEEMFSTTGCLLHFKFISTMAEKAIEEINRKEHYENSVEYIKYHSVISNSEDNLLHSASARYESSHQLCDLGLMTYGRWF